MTRFRVDLLADYPARVRHLVQRAAGPPEPAELRDLPAAMAAYHLVGVSRVRRPSKGLAGARAVALASAVVLMTGTGLAAADVLPAPAQRMTNTVLDRVGIALPTDHQPGTASPTQTTIQLMPGRVPTAATPDSVLIPGLSR